MAHHEQQVVSLKAKAKSLGADEEKFGAFLSETEAKSKALNLDWSKVLQVIEMVLPLISNLFNKPPAPAA